MTNTIQLFLLVDGLLNQYEDDLTVSIFELENIKGDLFETMTDDEFEYIEKLYDELYRKEW